MDEDPFEATAITVLIGIVLGIATVVVVSCILWAI